MVRDPRRRHGCARWRVARATRTGSQFGVELDSLVDAISFGVAPAFIMYFAVLNRDSWAWLVCFAYIACAVMRLARFNVEQGGRAKTHFHGLPSPAAGMTLATYYWFTPDELVSIRGRLAVAHRAPGGDADAELPDDQPRALSGDAAREHAQRARALSARSCCSPRSSRSSYEPLRFAFPILVCYVAFGLLRTIFFGLMERLPTGDPLMDDEDDEEPDEYSIRREIEVVDTPVGERRGRRRERRGPNFPKSTPPLE